MALFGHGAMSDLSPLERKASDRGYLEGRLVALDYAAMDTDR